MNKKTSCLLIILIFAVSTAFAKSDRKLQKSNRNKNKDIKIETTEVVEEKKVIETDEVSESEIPAAETEKVVEEPKSEAEPETVQPEIELPPPEPEIPSEPELLKLFKIAYPEVTFESEYDESMEDWKIKVTNKKNAAVLYWNKGSMITEEQLVDKDKYASLLYPYDYKKPLKNPAEYTQKEIDEIKRTTSYKARMADVGTPMVFFDVVYDSFTRVAVEQHIKKAKFLGFPVNIHERIAEPLARVEQRVLKLAETDEEMKKFIASLEKTEGYNWRYISNTTRKSFHSYGMAVDIQPKRYTGEVYWSWAKDKNPEKWMLTPVSRRWMPPESMIEIFEEEGFIWGGKWVIWDNMHFEYHPELILMAQQ